MKQSCELIVLRQTQVGSRSIVLHTLSAEFGRRSFIVSVSKTCPQGFLQPLSILNAEITPSVKSDLWRLGALVPACPLVGLRSSVSKNAVSMFISEVLFRTIQDGAVEDGLYEWCRRSILTLDGLDSSQCANFHLLWLLGFAAALGFAPSSDSVAPFAGEYYSDICRLLKSDFAAGMAYPLSGARRTGIARCILSYISFHSDIRLEIRSLDVLSELFI